MLYVCHRMVSYLLAPYFFFQHLYEVKRWGVFLMYMSVLGVKFLKRQLLTLLIPYVHIVVAMLLRSVSFFFFLFCLPFRKVSSAGLRIRLIMYNIILCLGIC